jgi:hypothetical protein
VLNSFQHLRQEADVLVGIWAPSQDFSLDEMIS